MPAARHLEAARFLVVVLVLTLSATLGAVVGCAKKPATTEARELFAATCARCHGAEGRGGLSLVDGGPSPRNLHDHEFQRTHTDGEIKAVIKNGKGIGMPGFGATFSDEQLAALIALVRSFDNDKGHPQ